MLGYLYANRFISIPVGAPNYEIYSFFSIWLGSFILACVTPQQDIWRMQLKLLICAAFIIPLIDIYYLVSQQYVDSFATYWPFLLSMLTLTVLIKSLKRGMLFLIGEWKAQKD